MGCVRSLTSCGALVVRVILVCDLDLLLPLSLLLSNTAAVRLYRLGW